MSAVKLLSAEEIALLEARDSGAPGPFVCVARDRWYPCPSCGAGVGEARPAALLSHGEPLEHVI